MVIDIKVTKIIFKKRLLLFSDNKKYNKTGVKYDIKINGIKNMLFIIIDENVNNVPANNDK
jgi:hypothetical protein